MARILAISSQVGLGAVGLSVIQPLLSALGHDVIAVPSVILPLRPDYGPSSASITKPETLVSALKTIEDVDLIMLGYFAHADQISAVSHAIETLRVSEKCPAVLLDPIMGDDGKRYIDSASAMALARELVPLADILTPNRFEADELFGIQDMDQIAAHNELIDKAPNQNVIITSAEVEKGSVAIWVREPGEPPMISRHDYIEGAPRGTGDVFSALIADAIVDSMTLTEAIAEAAFKIEMLIRTASAGDRFDVVHLMEMGASQ